VAVTGVTQLYFAYGSNLCMTQMAERCPSRQVVDRAVLPDQALIFPRRSLRRECGVASIVASVGCVVWGAVYRLTAGDVASLDTFEGFVPTGDPARNAYNKSEIAVLRDGSLTASIQAFTYIANPMPGRHIPSADYRGAMVRGAREHQLPPHYIDTLESLEIS
jgi:gamma-glutamylcyclotransferase (GGCT)/AIG2-like uncharacterized protein YtfP